MQQDILGFDPHSKRANLKLLKAIHYLVKPTFYMEIGVRWGDSLILSGDNALAIGIDPAPNLKMELPRKTYLIKKTSDDFFKRYHWYQKVYRKKPDLALIDGMHLSEYVLRDFINLEACMDKTGMIVLDDTNPQNAKMAYRERETNLWTGDVWKLLPILFKYRPDLEIVTYDVAPAGLTLIKQLDPHNTFLKGNYSEIETEIQKITFNTFVTELKPNVRQYTQSSLKRFISR